MKLFFSIDSSTSSNQRMSTYYIFVKYINNIYINKYVYIYILKYAILFEFRNINFGTDRKNSEQIGTNRNESEKFERDRISAIRARTYYKLQKMFSFTSFKQSFDFLR